MKKKFLTVYDYGMGGCWTVITASASKEITDKFPKLTVFDYDEPPEWMKKELIDQIESKGLIDIDGPYNQLLISLQRN